MDTLLLKHYPFPELCSLRYAPVESCIVLSCFLNRVSEESCQISPCILSSRVNCIRTAGTEIREVASSNYEGGVGIGKAVTVSPSEVAKGEEVLKRFVYQIKRNSHLKDIPCKPSFDVRLRKIIRIGWLLTRSRWTRSELGSFRTVRG